ncbi:MAG: alkaline phosphatase family protein [Anaerolineae bacterium]|nr:alkaline phosphatase family protein [Anaerolineae bacterium]
MKRRVGLFDRRKGKGKKVVVIGPDGTPLSLVQKLIVQGELPNFQRIFKDGSVRPMTSAIPSVSSVAWSSFMTGKNPGKHGIYGFLDRRPNTYDTYIPNAAVMRAETLWEILSRHGKRVVVMNVPVTYPPRQVNGILVGCFLSPKLEKATYPPQVAEQLKNMGYRIDVDPWQAREDRDKFLEDLYYTLDKREEAMDHFMKTEDWDFFMLQIMETDRLHHFLWEEMETGDPKYAPAFLKLYHKLDALLGRLYDRLGEDTTLIVMSDHGFTLMKKEVYINRWLEDHGWLSFTKQPPESLNDIHPDSRAYSMDPGRIFINLRGREPRGSVDLGKDYEDVRSELIDSLSGLSDPDSGEPMIEKVYRREEIYSGECYAQAPDLVAMPYRGYDLKGSIKKDVLTDRGVINGAHTYDDAMLYIQGEDIQKDEASIVDVMPTILHLMGVPIPQDVDGAVLI